MRHWYEDAQKGLWDTLYVYSADRLSMNGKEYSEMATALSDLGRKVADFMRTIKYVQDTLGDDYIKLVVEEYG